MFINGGSNLPSGSSPCSRHDTKERREPLEGKDNGGNCTPSWLIRTKLPPDSPEIREFIDTLINSLLIPRERKIKSSVIRPTGECQNGCYKKRKQNMLNFPKNEHFLPSDTHTQVCVYQGDKKCSFFGKFGVLCFLVTPILRFALLPCYRRNNL